MDLSTCEPVHFIVKRAFRRGSVSPADVTKACAISSAGATRAMSQAEAQYSNLLAREKTRLVPRPSATPPPFANEDALFKSLNDGSAHALSTGLFPSEVPVIYAPIVPGAQYSPGILTTLVQSIAESASLDLIYLPLAVESIPKSYPVFPIALERTGDSWRLVAQELTRAGAIIMFNLPQIMIARLTNKRLPRYFVPRSGADIKQELEVSISPRFTNAQVGLVEKLFNIKGGKVRVASRSAGDFIARFVGEPDADNGFWPPFVRADYAGSDA